MRKRGWESGGAAARRWGGGQMADRKRRARSAAGGSSGQKLTLAKWQDGWIQLGVGPSPGWRDGLF
eukprot:5343956-Prymnesium_polylepis.1